MVYHANQFYEQAERAYRIAARLSSDDYRWTYCQVLLEEERGREDAVLEFLQQTARTRPDYAPALQKLADSLFKRGKLDEAAQYYEQCVRAAGMGTGGQAFFGLGRIAAQRREWPRVVEYVAPPSREYPLIRPYHQLLLEAYEALGQKERAQEERSALLRPNLTAVPPVKDPLNEELLDLCCSSTRLLKQAGLLSRFSYADDVLRLARRAAEVEPEDADARYFLSIALLNTRGTDPNAVDEALRHLEEALRMKPDDPQSLQMAADLFFRRNKTESALERMRALLARQAASPYTRYYLGLATERQGRTREAADLYREAMKLNPDSAEAHCRLGLILAEEGSLDQAIHHFRKALQLKPASILAHYNFGVALEKQGRANQAVEQYEEVLRLDPDDFSAHMNLGVALGRSGRLEESERHFREAIRVRPEAPEAHYGLGCALAERNRVSESAAELRQALRLRPGYADARNRLEQIERTKER
jgi:tetratricopeptide (TPR) repeat protein